MCSETENSPQIPFSNNLIRQQEQDPLLQHNARRDCNLLDSNSDFKFNIFSSSLDHQSSADELFIGSVILPSLQLFAARNRDSQRNVSLSLSFDYENSVMKDRIMNAELEEKKSILGFKRRSSLNSNLKKSLISSFREIKGSTALCRLGWLLPAKNRCRRCRRDRLG